jgi:hypothetical protein
MKRLILTTSDSGAGCLKAAGVADKVVGSGHRFVVGPLLPQAKLAESLAPFGLADLADVADRFDAIDLWIDPDPNAQRSAATSSPAARTSAGTIRRTAGGAAPN